MATTRLMPLHIGEGRSFSTAIEDIIDYVENPEKTDYGKLIYGFECDTRTADAEFTLAKRQYIHQTGRVRGADDVIAYHFRQAFKPGEVTPEEANQIGQELAMRLTKGNNAFIVCTHIDKHHVHNHIIVSAVNLECTKKFRNFWGSSWALRRISDKLCLEHGLSIVEDPKPSRGHYGKWLGDGNNLIHASQPVRTTFTGQWFASGFLQTPPHGDALAIGCTLPTAGRVRDFHPLERAPAGHTRKAADFFQNLRLPPMRKGHRLHDVPFSQLFSFLCSHTPYQ